MKYFAALLPVEGEESGKPTGTEVTYGMPISPNSREFLGKLLRNDTGWDMYETLKLFLCSTDIHVDDDIYDNVAGLKGPYKATENSGKAYECFKIIGEISPAATWIKEGDEFDGKDVKVLFRQVEHFGPVGNKFNVISHKISEYDIDCLLDHWKKNNLKGMTEFTDGTKDYIAIKGPCGHYH